MKNASCDELLQKLQPSKSEAEELYSSFIVGCVLNAFLSFTAIMLNIATIYAVSKTSLLSQPLKTLLLSLAACDLGVGLLCQPYFTTLMVKWSQQSHPMSCATHTAAFTSISTFAFASLFGVVVLSIDRFMAIYLHLRYQELITHIRVVAVVISLWVFSAFLSLITLLVSTNIGFAFFAIVEVGCLLTAAFIYYKIYLAVRRHRNQIQSLQVPHQHEEHNHGEMANVASARKSALGTFYVYLVFLLCLLPQTCCDAVIATTGISTATKHFSIYAVTIAFLNSSLNPVIYCWKIRRVRRALMDILRNTLPGHN